VATPSRIQPLNCPNFRDGDKDCKLTAGTDFWLLPRAESNADSTLRVRKCGFYEPKSATRAMHAQTGGRSQVPVARPNSTTDPCVAPLARRRIESGSTVLLSYGDSATSYPVLGRSLFALIDGTAACATPIVSDSANYTPAAVDLWSTRPDSSVGLTCLTASTLGIPSRLPNTGPRGH
jgi:hypothetical protein